MGSGTSFETLLERLYACGADIGGAPDWLHAFKAPFNAHLVSLYLHDPGHRVRDLVHATEPGTCEPLDRLTHLEGGHLWFERGMSTLVGEGMCNAEELVSERELLRSAFYQDYLRGMDVRHGMALGVHVGAQGELAAVTINRNGQAGSFQQEDMDLARRLLPHVRNVYALQRRLSWAENLLGGFRAALDRLPTAAVLLDKHARIVFRNREAMRLIAEGQGLSEHAGHLTAPWSPDRQALRSAIEHRTSVRHVAQPRTLRLHDAHGQPVLAVTVLSVPPATAFGWSESISAIVFARPLRSPQPSAQALRHLFGFTTAEGDLARLLAQGATLADAAAALGKSLPTVRTQLRALFAKTGARRQAELVQVLLGVGVDCGG